MDDGRVAPECTCRIGSVCQKPACCYHGEQVPENAQKPLGQSGRSTAQEVEQACQRMGMEPGEPLRLLLTKTAQATDRIDAAVAKVGAEAAQRAGEGAMAVVRAEFRRLYVTANRLVLAIAVAVPVVAAGIGYWVGTRSSVNTEVGPLSQREAEVLRMNKLEAAIGRCPPDPGGPAGWSCAVPLWLRLPPARSGR